MKKDRLKKKTPFETAAQADKRDRPRYERAKKEIQMKSPFHKLQNAKKRGLREGRKWNQYGKQFWENI